MASGLDLKMLKPYDRKPSRTVLKGKGAVRLLPYPVIIKMETE